MSNRDISLKEQFEVDILDSLRKLPDGPFPFRRFILRCHPSCGDLVADGVREARELCRSRDAVFQRLRGTDLGWVKI